MNDLQSWMKWVHSTQRLMWPDCLKNVLMFVGSDERLGFLYAQDDESYDKLTSLDWHAWRSVGLVPPGCQVISNEVLERTFKEIVKAGGKADDGSMIARFISKWRPGSSNMPLS